MRLELIATATFGLEAVVKREIEQLGYKILKTEDGKVTYLGDERAIVVPTCGCGVQTGYCCKWRNSRPESSKSCSSGQRLWTGKARPAGREIYRYGTSVKSILHSVPACQKIVKKAIVERLRRFTVCEISGDWRPVHGQGTILKDRVTLTVDTSGAGLHKRGYGEATWQRPSRKLWRRRWWSCLSGKRGVSWWIRAAVRVLYQSRRPHGRNIAPGLNRILCL